MPFLTLKKVILSGTGYTHPVIRCFLITDHARDCLRELITRHKKAGYVFTPDSGPDLWMGSDKHESRVEIQLKDEPFDDNCQLFTPHVAIYSR